MICGFRVTFPSVGRNDSRNSHFQPDDAVWHRTDTAACPEHQQPVHIGGTAAAAAAAASSTAIHVTASDTGNIWSNPPALPFTDSYHSPFTRNHTSVPLSNDSNDSNNSCNTGVRELWHSATTTVSAPCSSASCPFSDSSLKT